MEKFVGRILVVDDEPSITEIMKIVLQDANYWVKTANSGFEALEILQKDSFDLVITDLRMPKMDGLELFEKVREFNSDIEFIVISAYSDVKKAVRAIRIGVYDYLQKDFSIEELLATVRKTIEKRKFSSGQYRFEEIIYRSKNIAKLCNTIKKIAPTKASVVLTGESGVGKEVFARTIHKRSSRSDAPFVALNCSALPDNLIESELFGYEKGAFTGATTRKYGRLELANGGTIFLDEIGDASPLLQSKILRFLQEGEFERLGGLEKIKIDVRVISATNKNLGKAIKEGKFREDLYYRLNIVNLYIPPLRQRTQDIPLLAQYFLGYYNSKYDKNLHGISTKALAYLMTYEWPGNVRELKNIIERAVAIADNEGYLLLPKHLPKNIAGEIPSSTEENRNLSLEELEKIHIFNILKMVHWNKSEAAEKLGINRQTLYNKMERYQLKELMPD